MEIKENRFTLAEGATHAANFAGRHKVAFTLAEVLITLGIIGVVAALTLPALIQNYQKKVYVNKLKKVSSTIEQGFGLMFADEGVDKFSDIPIFQYIDDTSDEELYKYLKKYFKFADVSEGATDEKPYVIKYIGLNYGDDLSSDKYLKFSDGTWIEFAYFPPRQHMIAQFDINGSQNPNEYGRDYFFIIINDNGKIVINKNPLCNVNVVSGDDYHSVVSGDDCYSKIVQDGWEMKY